MCSMPLLSAARHATRWVVALACGMVAHAAASALTPQPAWMYPATPVVPNQYTLTAKPSHIPLETSFGLAGRHELRFSTLSTSRYATRLGGHFAQSFEAPRATYRYTLAASPQWTWKVGLTSNLTEAASLLRQGANGALSKHQWFSALPLLHMGGEAQLAQRWRLAVDADGLITPTGHSLDIGLRVNYHLNPNFSLYGGWRLSDYAQEATDPSLMGLNNSADVGVRLKF